MVAKLKSADSSCRAARIHIGNRASVPHMVLQEEVRLAVAGTAPDSMWVIGKVYGAILDPFKRCSTTVLPVEHSIFPVGP